MVKNKRYRRNRPWGTVSPCATINFMSVFTPASRKIDQKLILSRSKLPCAVGVLVFHVSLHWEHRLRRVAAPRRAHPPSRRFARMHVAAAFFSPRRVAKIHADFSRGARGRPPPCGRKKIPLSPPSGQASFSPTAPSSPSSRPFFILSTLPDVVVRETNL